MTRLLLIRSLLQNPETKERVKKIDQWLIMDMIPICVYPVFTVVFMAIKSNQQLWLSLLLPVSKHVLKHIIWLALQDDLDLVGPTMSSVEHLLSCSFHGSLSAKCQI
ncbi:Kazal-like serine protease inhibitor [Phytophthora megakarya]|uniref:Kazal-like serine protease inhibitor n=1 Tax=Phytophthora megakarya TaxID=4795 RepID=A0A225UYK2_9STRA|nr:Kazal-like serine protease inhibitor [Phytophthora megakarya]